MLKNVISKIVEKVLNIEVDNEKIRIKSNKENHG